MAAAGGAAGEGELVVEPFPLEFEGYAYQHGKICYVKGRRPAPVVLVHPNYAGLKQFDVDVAAFLAKVGYVGLAVDIYMDSIVYAYEDRDPPAEWRGGPGPQLTEEEENALRRHRVGSNVVMDALIREPVHWRGLMKAYLDASMRHPAVSPGLAGAIGYCLGGQCVLEQVRAGHPLQAVVSFHGLLHSRPRHRTEDRRLTPQEFEVEVDVAPNTYNKDCKVLIEHGDLDDRPGRDAESIDAWRAEMNEQGIDWVFHRHSQAKHGFALAPRVIGADYSETADRRSTLAMLSLFAEVWPDFPQYPVECNASGAKLGQHIRPAKI